MLGQICHESAWFQHMWGKYVMCAILGRTILATWVWDWASEVRQQPSYKTKKIVPKTKVVPNSIIYNFLIFWIFWIWRMLRRICHEPAWFQHLWIHDYHIQVEMCKPLSWNPEWCAHISIVNQQRKCANLCREIPSDVYIFPLEINSENVQTFAAKSRISCMRFHWKSNGKMCKPLPRNPGSTFRFRKVS